MNTEILGLVPPEKREAAQAYLTAWEARPPKLLQGIFFIGAFISAIFIGGSGTLFFGWRISGAVIGAAFTALGCWLAVRNETRSDWGYVFLAQLGFVFGIIGRVTLLGWGASLFGYTLAGWMSVICVTAALSYPFFRSAIDRLFFCTWALCLLLEWVFRFSSLGEIPGAFLCILFFCGALWIFALRRVQLRPLAYAGILACEFGLVCLLKTEGANVVLVLAAGLAAFCVSRLPLSFKTRALICALTAAAACWLPVYAFAALFACAAGYYWRERLLEWLGLAGFATGLVWMYYDMNVTLLQKSGRLMLAGVCVLLAYAWVRRKYAR